MIPQDQDSTRLTAVEADSRTRLQGIENKLRWAETLWISNRRAIKGNIIAFHDPDTADKTRLPCFMLPSLPQLSTDYIEMGKMMDPKQPFFAVYLPSEKRTPESVSPVHKLARYYADEINNFQPSGPLAIGGWSAGGIVARRSAQILKEAGRDVRLLVIIDGGLPTVDPGPRGVIEKIQVFYNRILNLGKGVVELEREVGRRMRQKPPQRLGLASAIRSAWEFASLRQIWERAVDFVATKLGASKPAQVGPRRHPAEIASNISGLPAEHRACAIELYDAIDRYVPDDEYTGETVLYEATAEPDRGSERVAKKWAKISTNLTIVPVEGTHMSMVKPPRGVPLARDLCRRLGEIGSLASQGRDQSRPLKIAAHR